MSPADLWALLAATNPDGCDAFWDAVGEDAPRSLETFLALYEALPLSPREMALVALLLVCVDATVKEALPRGTLVQ